MDYKYDHQNPQDNPTLVRTQDPSPPYDDAVSDNELNYVLGDGSVHEDSAGTWQCSTDIDEKNVVEYYRPRQRGYELRVQYLIGIARNSVVTAEAPCDSAAPRVEAYKCEDDGKDPMHGRQHEYEDDEGEEAFPCSALESIGAVSWRKFGENKVDRADWVKGSLHHGVNSDGKET